MSSEHEEIVRSKLGRPESEGVIGFAGEYEEISCV